MPFATHESTGLYPSLSSAPKLTVATCAMFLRRSQSTTSVLAMGYMQGIEMMCATVFINLSRKLGLVLQVPGGSAHFKCPLHRSKRWKCRRLGGYWFDLVTSRTSYYVARAPLRASFAGSRHCGRLKATELNFLWQLGPPSYFLTLKTCAADDWTDYYPSVRHPQFKHKLCAGSQSSVCSASPHKSSSLAAQLEQFVHIRRSFPTSIQKLPRIFLLHRTRVDVSLPHCYYGYLHIKHTAWPRQIRPRAAHLLTA